jgi:hypothetical protein
MARHDSNPHSHPSVAVGANYKGLAQAQDGGTGDGYILPAPYSAQYYANIKVTYRF